MARPDDTRPSRARVLAPICAAVVVASPCAPGHDARASSDDPCAAWDIDYALNANVKMTDTPMGAANGTYAIGPGQARVRFESRDGAPGGRARLLSYRMRDHFSITTNLLLFGATVVADTVTTTTANPCGVSAEGTFGAPSLQWETPWSGIHSDGTVTCNGALCGKFGAPPSGRSPMHVAPHDARFKPFVFSSDRQTFTMDYSVVSHMDSPSQTSYVALAGRELKRTCVARDPLPTTEPFLPCRGTP